MPTRGTYFAPDVEARYRIKESDSKDLVFIPISDGNEITVMLFDDDDGIWFIKKDGDRRELQVESTYGSFPFLVESDFNNDRILVYNIEEALDLIYRLLNKTIF